MRLIDLLLRPGWHFGCRTCHRTWRVWRNNRLHKLRDQHGTHSYWCGSPDTPQFLR